MKFTQSSVREATVSLALLLLGCGGSASADEAPERLTFSLTGQPATYEIVDAPYHIEGYGKAHFGMTPAEVRAVVHAAYPAALATAHDEANPVTRTHTLTVQVDQLAPGPGPALIHYVFGASHDTLIGVHVDWVAPGMATQAQQEALARAGTTLEAGLLGYQWPFMRSFLGRVVAPGSLVLFSGTDPSDAAIEIRLDGVAFDVETPQALPSARPVQLVRRQPPPGPARLRLSAIANNSNPDVYRLPAGAF